MRTARIHEFLSKTWLAKNPFETKSLKNFLQNSGIYSHKIQSAHQRLKCSDEISVTLCPSTNKEEGEGRRGWVMKYIFAISFALHTGGSETVV